MLFLKAKLVYLLCAGSQLCNALYASDNNLQVPFNNRVSIASSTQRKAYKTSIILESKLLTDGRLTEAQIIPDALDDFAPSISVELSYPAKHKTVDLGNKIKPKHVGSQPVFNINTTDADPTPTQKSNATYVLALTDPDATSRADPAKAQMCHWIAANITIAPSASYPIDSSKILPLDRFDGESGGSGIEELIPYFPPTPPPKTGYHRYVFVVLTSESYDSETKLKKPKDRPHWGYGKVGAGVREWAKENSLTVVGANFFYSKNKKQ